MKINVEGSGLAIGVDNSLTESIKTGSWGVRLGIKSDDNKQKFEFVLTLDECESLINDINKALIEIDKLKCAINNHKETFCSCCGVAKSVYLKNGHNKECIWFLDDK